MTNVILKNIQVGSWNFSLNNYGRLFVKEEKPGEKELIDITPSLGVRVWVSDFDVYYDEGNDKLEPKPSMRIVASAVFLDTPPSDVQSNIRYQSPFSLFRGGIHYIDSAPFVGDDGIYSKVGDEIYKLKNDTGEPIATNLRIKSTPFVDGDHFYLQGLGDGLYKAGKDGSDCNQISRISDGQKQGTLSTPFVKDGWIYFRGTDDNLYKIKTEGSINPTPLGQQTKASPFVKDNWVIMKARAKSAMKGVFLEV